MTFWQFVHEHWSDIAPWFALLAFGAVMRLLP